MRDYRLMFADLAAEHILALPRRRQRMVMQLAYQLAKNPFLRSDYTLADADGHPIEHLYSENFIFTFYVDHAACMVILAEIDEV